VPLFLIRRLGLTIRDMRGLNESDSEPLNQNQNRANGECGDRNRFIATTITGAMSRFIPDCRMVR
jgi:hypothetical protein